MLYLSPIYGMIHFFGIKTLIQLKGFTYNRQNPSECFFKAEITIQVLYLKCPKFFDKTALGNYLFISRSSFLPSLLACLLYNIGILSFENLSFSWCFDNFQVYWLLNEKVTWKSVILKVVLISDLQI